MIHAWRQVVTRLLDHPRGQDVLFALLSWYFAVHRSDRDTLRIVMTQIREIQEENPPMRTCLDLLLEMNEERGLQKGLQQGLQQGLQSLRTVLDGLLRTRFGNVPTHYQEHIATANAEALQRWSLRVLDAARIDDVFAAG